MKLIEIICFINSLSLIALIFIRTPLKMARIETNTNRNLDITVISFTIFYLGLILALKCW